MSSAEDFQQLTPKARVAKVIEQLEKGGDDAESCIDWFLAIYDPAKHYTQIQDDASAIKNQELLDLVVSNEAFPNAPEKFLRFMRIFSTIEGYEEDVYEANGVVEICNVMKSNETEDIQIEGCKALAALALDDIVRELMSEEGCIQQLVNGLRLYNKSSGFVIEVSKAINNISFNCEENKDYFGEEGGVAQLFTVIEEPSVSEPAKSAAIQALRNLCNNDTNKLKVIEAGGVPKLVAVMGQYIANKKLQLNALWCLLNLTFTSPEYKRFIGEDGGNEAVVTTLKAHKDDKVICKTALIAILQLSKLVENRAKIGQQGTLACIIEILKLFEEDIEIVQLSLVTLERLCRNASNRNHLTDAGGVPCLIKCIQDSIENEDVVTTALAIVYKLASTDPIAKEKIKANDGITVCVKVMDQHRHNIRLRKLSSDTMNACYTEETDTSSSDSDSDSSDDDSDHDHNDHDLGNIPPRPMSSSLGAASTNDMLQVHSLITELKKQLEEANNLRTNLQVELDAERLKNEKLNTQILLLESKVQDKDLQLEQAEKQKREVQEWKDKHNEVQVALEGTDDLKKRVANLESSEEKLKDELKNSLASNEDLQGQLSKLAREYEAKLSAVKEESKKVGPAQNGDAEEAISAKEDVQHLKDMLFYWMALAIKLNIIAFRDGVICNFDSQSCYEDIVRKDIHYSKWPDIIVQQAEKHIKFIPADKPKSASSRMELSGPLDPK